MLPVLIVAGEKHVSEVSGVKQGTVRYVLKGRSPRLAQRGKLLAAADRIAREGLASADREVPLTMTGRLSLWARRRYCPPNNGLATVADGGSADDSKSGATSALGPDNVARRLLRRATTTVPMATAFDASLAVVGSTDFGPGGQRRSRASASRSVPPRSRRVASSRSKTPVPVTTSGRPTCRRPGMSRRTSRSGQPATRSTASSPSSSGGVTRASVEAVRAGRLEDTRSRAQPPRSVPPRFRPGRSGPALVGRPSVRGSPGPGLLCVPRGRLWCSRPGALSLALPTHSARERKAPGAARDETVT